MYAKHAYVKARRKVRHGGGSFLSDSINSPTFPAQNVVYGNLSGVGLDWQEALTNITGAVSKVVETAVPAYTTLAIAKINAERAKQGLPPMDAAAYAPTLNVAVKPDDKTLWTAGGLGVGLLALGAVALFLILRRK